MAREREREESIIIGVCLLYKPYLRNNIASSCLKSKSCVCVPRCKDLFSVQGWFRKNSNNIAASCFQSQQG